MAYKDKLRSSKGAKTDTLDKAGKQLEKNSNDIDSGLKKMGRGVVKTKGNMTLDKAGGEIENFGNGITNGYTRTEYIGVLAALGILITAVLIGGLAAACPYLDKSFVKAGGELVEFGKHTETAIYNAGVELDKVYQGMLESFDKVGEKFERLGNYKEDKSGGELKKFGKYMEEGIDNAGVEMKKFNHDMIESFDKFGEDLERFGKYMEEEIEKVNQNMLELFDK